MYARQIWKSSAMSTQHLKHNTANREKMLTHPALQTPFRLPWKQLLARRLVRDVAARKSGELSHNAPLRLGKSRCYARYQS